MDGSDAVLSAIGPPMNGKITPETEKAYSDSLEFIIQQMKSKGQKRFVSISGAGIKGQQEKLPIQRKLMRAMLKIMANPVVRIKENELKLLENSELNWTNIRPPMIKDNLEGSFVFDESKFLGMSVDVDQLAEFMLKQLSSDNSISKAFVVGTVKN